MIAEMKENFGEDVSKDDCAVICDDCYIKIKPNNGDWCGPDPNLMSIQGFLAKYFASEILNSAQNELKEE